jgi:hypothetical protein
MRLVSWRFSLSPVPLNAFTCAFHFYSRAPPAVLPLTLSLSSASYVEFTCSLSGWEERDNSEAVNLGEDSRGKARDKAA